jgi:hypothetical protein
MDIGNQALENQANWYLLVDKTDPNTIYIGKTDHANTTADSKWQIRRIVKTDTSVEIKFPDGNDAFEYKWEDRASYSY